MGFISKGYKSYLSLTGRGRCRLSFLSFYPLLQVIYLMREEPPIWGAACSSDYRQLLDKWAGTQGMVFWYTLRADSITIDTYSVLLKAMHNYSHTHAPVEISNCLGIADLNRSCKATLIVKSAHRMFIRIMKMDDLHNYSTLYKNEFKRISQITNMIKYIVKMIL